MTPWTPEDGPARHNKAVKSKKAKKQWAAVANDVLKRTGDDGRAIRAANAAVKYRNKPGMK